MLISDIYFNILSIQNALWCSAAALYQTLGSKLRQSSDES